MYIPEIPKKQHWDGQFLVSETKPIREGWVKEIMIGKQSVYLYPQTKFVLVKDREGNTIGVFIGSIIDVENEEVISSDVIFKGYDSRQDLENVIEEFAYSYGGSWVFIFRIEESVRIYLDSDGTIPVVFEQLSNIAASTTSLILNDRQYVDRFDEKLFLSLDVVGQGWFPSGETAHKDLERLICNHYLDLNSMTVHRHWPTKEFKWTSNINDTANSIAKIAKSSARALLKQGKVAMALTGGNETRFLMSAYKDIRHEFDFVTLSGPTTKRDVYLASKILNLTQVNHQFLPLISADIEEQREWIYQAGHCASTNMTGYTTLKPLSGYSSFIGGLGGEIGRGFIWRESDNESTQLTAKSILSRLGLPQIESVVERVELWMQPLQGMNSLSILDLAYLELRMSTWAFCHSYTTYVPHFHPLICRKSFNLMLNMSPEHKRNKQLIHQGVHSMWPELLSVPINRYGNIRDFQDKLSRLSKPSLWLKKMRKLHGS
ncbi:MAG: hypothetical protein ACRBEE_06320 [Arenicella sp.]